MFNLFIKFKLDFLNIKAMTETIEDKIDEYTNSKFRESKNTREKGNTKMGEICNINVF